MKKILNYSVVLFVLTIILLLIIPLPAGMVAVSYTHLTLPTNREV